MKANCTICCDLFDEVASVVATSCGHTFHEICLLQWVEQSRTCPSCRKPVSHRNIIRLFFNNVAQSQQLDVDKVQNELDSLKADLKVKQLEEYKMKTNLDELRSLVVKTEIQLEDAKEQLGESRSNVTSLKTKVKNLTKELLSLDTVKNENCKLREQLQHLKTAEMIVKGCDKDIKEIMQQYANSPAAKQQLATYCALLKTELRKATDTKHKLQEELKAVKKELGLKTSWAYDTLDKMKKADAELEFWKESVDGVSSMSQKSAIKRQISEATSESYSFIPEKRAKINILSPYQRKMNESDRKFTRGVLNSFATIKEKDDSSVVSVGYDGMGGHGRHIIRTTKPLPRVKIRKLYPKKEITHGSVHGFLFKIAP